MVEEADYGAVLEAFADGGSVTVALCLILEILEKLFVTADYQPEIRVSSGQIE